MSKSSTQIMRKYAIKEEENYPVINLSSREPNLLFQTSHEEDSKLTPEQIENWRRILVTQIGPYALFMSLEEIQEHRDMIQKQVNKIK